MSRVLVLNQNFEPLSVCTPQRAITLMVLRKVESVEQSGDVFHGATIAFPVPSVVRVNYYVRAHKTRTLMPTKKNVLRRDSHTCQYCGAHYPEMTVDHVVSQSVGGEDTWENLVCCCVRCNSVKSDRTPAEAKMVLKRKPKKPHFFTFILAAIHDIPETWKQYLFAR